MALVTIPSGRSNQQIEEFIEAVESEELQDLKANFSAWFALALTIEEDERAEAAQAEESVR